MSVCGKRDIRIGRQPIINRDEIIIGYEILFRIAGDNAENVVDNVKATASTLESILDVGLETLIGNKLGFISVDCDILAKGIIDILPENKIVLDFHCGLRKAGYNEKILPLIKNLKNKGFRFSLNGSNFVPGMEQLLKSFNYAKLDIERFPGDQIKEILSLLKYNNRKLKFIADKVETYEDYLFYKDMDFELYKGGFLEKPSEVSYNRMDSNHAVILKILESIEAKADAKEIEKLLKLSPDLIFRLLRVINSVIYDFTIQITSVRQAIVLLGYDHLLRWIIMLIFASDKNKACCNPIMESGMIKARMMEEICKEFINAGLSDRAFLAGMFSVINVIMGIPMGELFNEISVDKSVREGLIDRKGEIGKLVTFMDSYNAKDYKKAAAALEEINRSATMDAVLSIENEAIKYLESVKKTIN